MEETQLPAIPREISEQIDTLLLGFLEEKFQHTQSKRTVETYRQILMDFRLLLQKQSRDLIFDGNKDDIRVYLANQARGFAMRSAQPGHAVSSNTRNLRLSTLSSFYEYAGRAIPALFSNPIDLIKRSKSEPYNGAAALDKEDVLLSLKAIDTEEVQGKRDYALLHILLNTGQRVQSVQSLRWENVRVSRNGTVTIEFKHMKGDKNLSLQLEPRVSKLLLDYLASYYGSGLTLAPDAPIWVNLSEIPNKRQNPGQALGYQAIRKICTKHLGVSKVHTTRHTFTLLMQEAGASIEELQESLLHSNIAVTQVYARHIKRGKNTRSKDIADMLGL